jgi:predicted nucleic acid-binding Zn ribbon protein
MKRGETKSIAELVRQMCREDGLETPLNEYRLIQAWSKVLGPAVQSYTKDLRIHNQVLYVSVTSSVLRQELLMNRKALVHKLNGFVKAQVITDIVFR